MNFKILLNNLRTAFMISSLKQNRHRILIMLIIYPLIAILSGNWIISGVFTFGSIFLTDLALRHYLNALDVRINNNNSVIWDVEMNKIKVGTITDAEYAAICYRVFSDAHSYYAQGINILSIVSKLFNYCLRVIPLGFFWVIAGIAIFSPHNFSEIVSAIQHATPMEINQAVNETIRLLVIPMFLVIGVYLPLNFSQFGFINCFGNTIAILVRKRRAISTEGKITLSCLITNETDLTNQSMFFKKIN